MLFVMFFWGGFLVFLEGGFCGVGRLRDWLESWEEELGGKSMHVCMHVCMYAYMYKKRSFRFLQEQKRKLVFLFCKKV